MCYDSVISVIQLASVSKILNSYNPLVDVLLHVLSSLHHWYQQFHGIFNLKTLWIFKAGVKETPLLLYVHTISFKKLFNGRQCYGT